MDPREILFCIFLLFLAVAEAIKCKCTKESETVSCYDGVCEMEGGSCLMLHHPTMGVHYTCHTKGLKDGSCRNKTSKSGAPVRICGCEASDFCNYSSVRSVAQQRSHDVSPPPTLNSVPVFVPSYFLFVFLQFFR